MSDFRELSDTVLASPQLTPDDIATACDAGVRLIVNNRPDGEAESQTPGSEIEAAARHAGLDYTAIPIGRDGFGEAQVQAMREALSHAQGKVLAYCRTGTRSTLLWALARAAAGEDPQALADAAAAAGYDVAPIRSAMDALAARSRT